MRFLIVLMLTLAVLASGCSDASPPLETDQGPIGGNETAAPEPPGKANGPQEVADQSFGVTGSWVAAIDVQNIGLAGICSLQTEDCHRHAFTVDNTTSVRAVLSWGLAANDLDLYLFQGSTELSRDGINSLGSLPETSQTLNFNELKAGTYELVVVPWNAVAESYTLDVTLS